MLCKRNREGTYFCSRQYKGRPFIFLYFVNFYCRYNVLQRQSLKVATASAAEYCAEICKFKNDTNNVLRFYDVTIRFLDCSAYSGIFCFSFYLFIYCLLVCLFVCLVVFTATFNNILVISWRSVLLVEKVIDKLYHIVLYTSP